MKMTDGELAEFRWAVDHNDYGQDECLRVLAHIDTMALEKENADAEILVLRKWLGACDDGETRVAEMALNYSAREKKLAAENKELRELCYQFACDIRQADDGRGLVDKWKALERRHDELHKTG